MRSRKVPIREAKKNDVHKGTAEWFLLSQLFAVPSQRVGRVAAARLGTVADVSAVFGKG